MMMRAESERVHNAVTVTQAAQSVNVKCDETTGVVIRHFAQAQNQSRFQKM